jgi:hypothetical protein
MNKQFIWELVEQISSYFLIYKTIVLRQSMNNSQKDTEVSIQFANIPQLVRVWWMSPSYTHIRHRPKPQIQKFKLTWYKDTEAKRGECRRRALNKSFSNCSVLISNTLICSDEPVAT